MMNTGGSVASSSAVSPGGNQRHSGREVIHIQVGKSGGAIGHEFWRDLCEEHCIEYDNTDRRGSYIGNDNIYEDHLNVFFNEGSPGKVDRNKPRWVPRCILVDLDMQDLACLTQDNLGDMYRPENIIGNDEGSGNCYAKAFHTEGPDLADRCLENVRKEVERCDCLQGVQFTHSVTGGTGSGLTGLLLKTLHEYLDKGSKCIMQTFSLVPSPRTSDVLIEPYNAALGLQDLLEYCHQVFFFDNEALSDICQKTLDLDTPKMRKLNNIVALCMSGLTSCLRFSGQLNADLRKIQTNLVPFKNAHFLITGIAPLTSAAGKKYRKSKCVLDLAQQMMSKDNVVVKCDPLNPGDNHGATRIDKARFLASWASWRGNFQTYEVDDVLHAVQKPASRFDQFFPDWIPNSIASNICRVPHKEMGDMVTFVSNNTAVHEVFDRIIKKWDSMYQHKAYLHVFENDGISKQDMLESRNILQYISDEYLEFARWEDKFIGDDGVIKESAIENEDQQRTAQELQELRDGTMYVRNDNERGGR